MSSEGSQEAAPSSPSSWRGSRWWRWAKRLGLGLLGMILLGTLTCAGFYWHWRSTKLDELSSRSEIAKLPAGPLEYGIEGPKEGMPVLIIHGTPGGYDQGLAVGRLFQDKPIQVISPSRPGYLRTPLRTGPSPEAQADAYAALLDHLGFSSAVLVAISGGGPSTLQFALRHPDRCSGMVLVASVTRAEKDEPLSEEGTPPLIATLLGTDFGSWLLSQLTSLTVRALEPDEQIRRAILDDAEKAPIIEEMAESAAPISLRREGSENDSRALAAGFDYPLEEIRCPTRIIHGGMDSLVPVDQAKSAADRIPGATLTVIPRGGHLSFMARSDQLVRAVTELAQEQGNDLRAQ